MKFDIRNLQKKYVSMFQFWLKWGDSKKALTWRPHKFMYASWAYITCNSVMFVRVKNYLNESCREKWNTLHVQNTSSASFFFNNCTELNICFMFGLALEVRAISRANILTEPLSRVRWCYRNGCIFSIPSHWLIYIFGVADQNMRCCMVEFYKCDDYVCCHYFGAKNCISPNW